MGPADQHGVFICRHIGGLYCLSYDTARGLVADRAKCRKKMGMQIQKCHRLIPAAWRKRSVVRNSISRAPESVLEKITSLSAKEWRNNECSVHDQWNRTRQRNWESNTLTVQRLASVLQMHTNIGHVPLYECSHPR